MFGTNYTANTTANFHVNASDQIFNNLDIDDLINNFDIDLTFEKEEMEGWSLLSGGAV